MKTLLPYARNRYLLNVISESLGEVRSLGLVSTCGNSTKVYASRALIKGGRVEFGVFTSCNLQPTESHLIGAPVYNVRSRLNLGMLKPDQVKFSFKTTSNSLLSLAWSVCISAKCMYTYTSALEGLGVQVMISGLLAFAGVTALLSTLSGTANVPELFIPRLVVICVSEGLKNGTQTRS